MKPFYCGDPGTSQLSGKVKFALVGMSCLLEINNIYSTNAFAFVLFCAN